MVSKLRASIVCGLLACSLSVYAECDHGGGGGRESGNSGKRGGGSGGGSSHKSGSSSSGAANYRALSQQGYYRDAKTGQWYYQPDTTKAAIRVAPPALAKTAGLSSAPKR